MFLWKSNLKNDLNSEWDCWGKMCWLMGSHCLRLLQLRNSEIIACCFLFYPDRTDKMRCPNYRCTELGLLYSNFVYAVSARKQQCIQQTISLQYVHCVMDSELFVSRLLETESVCPMCSETLSVKQVKKISDCSSYLQAHDLEQWGKPKQIPCECIQIFYSFQYRNTYTCLYLYNVKFKGGTEYYNFFKSNNKYIFRWNVLLGGECMFVGSKTKHNGTQLFVFLVCYS